MSEHTPGPWTGITGQTTQFGSIHTDDTRIATVEPDFTEETEANIRLIAAAPDLLAALGDMIVQFQENEQYSDDDAKVVAYAREAYGKAGGAK